MATRNSDGRNHCRYINVNDGDDGNDNTPTVVTRKLKVLGTTTPTAAAAD